MLSRRLVESASAAVYARLIKEIGEIGWDSVLDAGDALDWIRVGITDRAGSATAFRWN